MYSLLLNFLFYISEIKPIPVSAILSPGGSQRDTEISPGFRYELTFIISKKNFIKLVRLAIIYKNSSNICK